jgi:2-polyprenyl-6-methoxyphenol hydroxylase-like FAD-dependent oxidoreductase
MTPETQPVVGIVGGGPVGLSLSLQLGRLGIRSVLVEQNASITTHPKARGVWARTMELFRLWGIEKNVRRQGLQANAIGVAFVETISGREFGRAIQDPEMVPPTPAGNCNVAQDIVEEELLAAIRQISLCQVFYSHELIEHREVEDGVEMTARDLLSGETKHWRVDYLVAADGANSKLRDELGIEMVGPGVFMTATNYYWQGDLSHIESVRQVAGYRVATGIPGVPIGIVLNTNGKDRWLMGAPVEGEDSRPLADEDVVKLARAYAGIPNLDVKVINNSIFRASRQVAASYSKGRVFLVGDAAHRFPPTGGFGMNTGIQDAHNLAWKLAMVLRGKAGEDLLDTYDSERRPIGNANADFAMGNMGRFRATTEALRSGNRDRIEFWLKDTRHHVNSHGLGLGFSYDEGAVIPDGTVKPVVPPGRYEPSDRPGRRFPHMWLDLSRQRSTIDLFERNFAVLHGAASREWAEAAKQAGETLGIEVDSFELATVDPRDGLEMGTRGVVLIRPDGHVAWRMHYLPTDPAASLTAALATVLCRTH